MKQRIVFLKCHVIPVYIQEALLKIFYIYSFSVIENFTTKFFARIVILKNFLQNLFSSANALSILFPNCIGNNIKVSIIGFLHFPTKVHTI